MSNKLGIIAGGGRLPRLVIDACQRAGRDCYVVALEGQADHATVQDVPHSWVRLGAAARALALARQEEVGEIVLAGHVKRPSLASLRPDWRTIRFLMRLGRSGLGDDGLLRRIVEEIEAEGFHVVGADTIVPDLKAEAGALGRHAPDSQALDDIRRGADVLRAMSAADVGQAVVVQQGIVLGVEAIEGTDALLDRCAGLKREGPGGVLVKMRKSGQEDRIDMPTIGVDTVTGATRAGLRGIAIEAGGAMLIDRQALIERADEEGLFVVAIEAA